MHVNVNDTIVLVRDGDLFRYFTGYKAYWLEISAYMSDEEDGEIVNIRTERGYAFTHFYSKESKWEIQLYSAGLTKSASRSASIHDT